MSTREHAIAKASLDEQAPVGRPDRGLFARLPRPLRAWLSPRVRRRGRSADHAGGARDARLLPGLARLALDGGWSARVRVGALTGPGHERPENGRLTLEHWRAWLRRPTDWLKVEDPRDVIKTSSTSLVRRARLEAADVEPIDVIIKRRRARHVLSRMKDTFRTSRPRRTCRRARALLSHGVPTARVLAVVERYRFGLLRDSLLMTEFLPHTVDLETLLTVNMRDMDSGRIRRLKGELTDALIHLIRRLETGRFVDRDFKAPNVLVQWDPDTDAPPRIMLVDLDGIRRLRLARRQRIWRMIMRLNVSLDGFQRVTRTDRLRFVRRYVELTGRPPDAVRPLWSRLSAMSDRKRRTRARSQARTFEKYGRY